MSESPVLSVGARGRFLARDFRVTGCVTLGHPSGARWREWSLAFTGGPSASLAEAQGRWFVTLARARWLPPVASLLPGCVASEHFVVTERAEATVLATQGSVPSDLRPGLRYVYVDLSGPRGGFATIEQGSGGDTVYVGREVFLDELRLAPYEPAGDTADVCPSCDAVVPVRARAITVCATCPNCLALLDVEDAQVTSELAHVRGRVVTSRLPLGTRAAFEDPGEPFTLVGVFRRAAGRAVWDEQLWYHPARGVRWLADSDQAFVYAIPVGPGEVPASVGRAFARARLERTTLRAWSGEAPWHARDGERSDTYEHTHKSGRFGLERDDLEVRAARLVPLSARDVREAIARADDPRRKALPSAKGLATLGALQSSRRARLVARNVPELDPLGVRA